MYNVKKGQAISQKKKPLHVLPYINISIFINKLRRGTLKASEQVTRKVRVKVRDPEV